MGNRPELAAATTVQFTLPVAGHGYRREVVRTAGGWVHCEVQCATMCAEHRHEEHLRITVTEEKADFSLRWRPTGATRRSTLRAQGRQVLIVPPGVAHEVVWHREVGVATLYMELPWVQWMEPESPRQVSIEPVEHYSSSEPAIGEMLGIMHRAAHTSGPADEPVLGTMGAALAGQLLRAHRAARRNRHPKRWALTRPALDGIRDYIKGHLHEPHTLANLGARAGMSANYFGQCFKAAEGMPPMTYVYNQRVIWARSLLRTGKHTVAEVAQMVGFTEQGQLDYHFRRVLNNAPRDYLPRRKER
ncbi:MAG: hypothetical protein RL091_1269 [Verrucomicrobiota bacterium]